jgi:hypothetical protein
MQAADMFVEPAENVTVGTVTEANCTTANCVGGGSILRINGARMVPIRDPRMPAGPVTNEFGFAVNLTNATNLVGRPAEAEGYFANNRFFYFLMSVSGAPLANTNPEVSIQRAQCTNDPDGISLDVLGSTHPRNGVVTITDGAGTEFGTINPINPGVAGFGSFTFRLRNDLAFTTCPDNVTVNFRTATATSAVDVR